MKLDLIEALELAEKELGAYGDVEVLVRKSGLCTLEVRIVVWPHPHITDQRRHSSAYHIDTREVAALMPPLKHRFEMLVASLVLHIERSRDSE